MNDAGRVHGAQASGEPGGQDPDRQNRQRTTRPNGLGEGRASDVIRDEPWLSAIRVGVHDVSGKNSADALDRFHFLREPVAKIGIVGELAAD